LKTIDLFAGCGGLSLGLKYAGYEVQLASDYKDYAGETFSRNFKNTEYLVADILDIEKGNWDNLKKYKNKIDLVAGGPPCQGFSMANRQRLSDDPRNKLYKSFLGAVNFLQPKCVLMENVEGITKVSENIFKEFDDIGYSGGHFVLNAKDFGIPQNRKRAFFILFKGGKKRNEFRLKKIEEYLDGEMANSEKYLLKDALFGLRRLKAKTVKNRTDLESSEYGYRMEISKKFPQNDFLKLINKSKTNGVIYNHLSRFNNTRDIEIFRLLPKGQNSLHQSIQHLMPYKTRNHIFKDKYFKLNPNKPSKTITAHMSYDCNMYIHPTQARGLTPREAARIQTFPDHFEFLGSYTKWYQQIGNAVPPHLGMIVGKSIMKSI
jgi:DNA (cytosine-5)-methyltransferase 1|tara:strand:+ start:456 stop:1583 length:1128 start_codon:yes stop_codon:yes gene_type:complete